MAVAPMDEAVQSLRESLRGELITPLDSGYSERRLVWNGMIDRRPALIVRCAGAADVIGAVKFARKTSMQVSVRGGGHSISGASLREDALLIDLSPMKGIRVDPDARTVRAEAGVLLGEFDRETTAFGLVTTMGIASTTGIAGLTLGGGLGYLMGKYGLASDNLVSADVVTAEGQFLKASESENPDLFWALRGGGGNFGVVTSFEYRLHPLEPITGGVAIYPLSQAKDFLRFYRELTSSAPDSLTVYAGIANAPPGTPVEGQTVVAAVACHSGPLAEGERLLKPLKEFGPPMLDALGPIPYAAQQGMFDAAFAPGNRGYWRAYFLRELTDAAIDSIVERTRGGIPGIPGSGVFLEHIHGAVGRAGQSQTAFSNRAAAYSLGIFPSWADPHEDARITSWTREFGDEVKPFSTGAGYVNYMTDDEGELRIRSTFEGNYDRLAAVKAKYDPSNFFNSNQNVKPQIG